MKIMKMKMMNKYYRIVYFHKNGKFDKVVITNDEIKIKNLIILQTPNIKIYRCNENGNNYTNRQIY